MRAGISSTCNYQDGKTEPNICRPLFDDALQGSCRGRPKYEPGQRLTKAASDSTRRSEADGLMQLDLSLSSFTATTASSTT
jgi:hypothetical protein